MPTTCSHILVQNDTVKLIYKASSVTVCHWAAFKVKKCKSQNH